ncbi:hypothetical protein [Croceicoccus gelatinilyticus]|uniref:hypothetical protein n=1 Tax=Croceicoccus gelatinilyticus TaxID=2835536 RepID=UPI001BCF2404|nr:hypothetical protein [Croceicoccus gelatinilyticus]MBS7671441.1 hypothetical protein [Croceicoccus gelatinilyticus]
MKRFALTLAAIGGLLAPANAGASGFQDFVDALDIETYTVKREDSNLYLLTSYKGTFLVQTRYCYVYAMYGKAFVYEDVLYFVDQDDSCDVKEVYRK